MAKKAVEQTGLIPRSIIRTFDRFRKQLFPGAEKLIIQEFRISRYQFLVSIKCLVSLLLIPFTVNYLLKNFILIPVTENLWNTHQSEIFLNSYQQDRAFAELKKFQEKLYFEYLVNDRENYIEIDLQDPLTSKYISTFDKKLSTSKFYLNQLDTVNEPIAHKTYSKIFIQSTNGDETKKTTKITNLCFDNLPINSSSFNKKDICRVASSLNLNLFNPNELISRNDFLVHNNARPWLKNNTIKDESNLYLVSRDFISTDQAENFETTGLNFSALEVIEQKIKYKTLELAIYYNHQSILALTNLIGDFITFVVISILLVYMKPQIIILKSFLTESIYSLNDTKKSFLLILGTDLLVGFHSPRGWEICLELVLKHFGFPENKDFVFLFVASFPVLLDTVFKYWIFRYLNKISPSTVATYHSMIE